METFSINDPADRERCGVDSLDLNSFVTERRRTGTDRSRPGIPADDYTPGAFFQADSSTGLPSTSQGSTWETVSGTSHSQDFSLVDGVQDESIPAESQSLHGRALPPDITFTEPPLQSAHDAGSRFDQWNRPQMGGDQAQIFPHLQPASTGSLDFGPGTPISDISRSVSSLMVDTIFQQPPPNVQAYFTPDMFMFPAFDLLSGFQTSGRSSSIGCLPDDSGQLGFSDTGESTSASDSVSPSSANRRYESYAGPVHRHDDSHLTITTPSHTLKRKRSIPSSPPTRTNLDKINGVRERHACIRCRFLHEECDVNEICSNCVKVHLTGKIWKNQPCFRGTLSSVKVHRYAALSFPDGIPKLKLKKEDKSLSLYHVGLAGTSEHPGLQPQLQVDCQVFHETEKTCSHKSWIRGNQKIILRLPPYAMSPSQTAALNKKIDPFLQTCFPKLLTNLRSTEDDLTSIIISEAARHSRNCKPLNGALEIALITRLTLKSFNITGSETLGIKKVEDPKSPYWGRVPIPPLLDAQIDRIWMDRMVRLKKTTLASLNAMMTTSQKRRENWYMTFLTTLMLLYNIEIIYHNRRDQTERYRDNYGLRDEMMASWVHGAQVLSWYFHVVFRGAEPLNMPWDIDTRQAVGVDAQAIQFLISLKNCLISRIGNLHEHAGSSPETPLVWISALFVP